MEKLGVAESTFCVAKKRAEKPPSKYLTKFLSNKHIRNLFPIPGIISSVHDSLDQDRRRRDLFYSKCHYCSMSTSYLEMSVDNIRFHHRMHRQYHHR